MAARPLALSALLALAATTSCALAPDDEELESPLAGTGLVFSLSTNRASPAPLQDASLVGNAYIFAAPDPRLKAVRFWLDNATPSNPTGTPTKTESVAPFDFAGTAADGGANPAVLTAGTHTIAAQATLLDGSILSLGSARFTLAAGATAMGPLTVNAANRNYFLNSATGTAVYLTGSHIHNSLQDRGGTWPPPALDFAAYLTMLKSNGHNFIRLWAWEHQKWDSWLNSARAPTFTSTWAFSRPGPGTALDGFPKYDLTRLNQAYFDRLRSRVIQARNAGIYVSIMLFQGVDERRLDRPDNQNPWNSHPFNASNNVNGVNGDPPNDSRGLEIHDWAKIPPSVWALQQRYIAKVIDTIGDLDNVLFEVGNEHHAASLQWQNEVAKFVKAYEAPKPKHHPVGITALAPNQGTLDGLLNNVADWVSPSSPYWPPDSPPTPVAGKVILSDTDHFFPWPANGYARGVVWKAFTRGNNFIYMDELRLSDANRLDVRKAMGRTLAYANKLNLAAVKPATSSIDCSTTFLLREPGKQYIAYHPGGTSLSLLLPAGTYSFEIYDPADASVTTGTITQAALGQRAFTRPAHAASDWAVYLKAR